MIYSKTVKPISYFKAHASEVVKDVVDNHTTMIITQNGEARVVLQDVKAYEELQESLAMLKILALSNKSINDGRLKKSADAFKNMRSIIDERYSE